MSMNQTCQIQSFFLSHFLWAILLISLSITHFFTMHFEKTIRNLSMILQTDRERKKKKKDNKSQGLESVKAW